MANTVRISFKFDFNGPIGGFRVHLGYDDGPPDDATGDAIASKATGQWDVHCAGLCAVGLNLVSVNVRDLASKTGVDRTDTTGSNGTRAGAPLDVSACMLVNYKIRRQYRGGKPRSYIPWGTFNDLQNSRRWSQAFLDECGSHWAQWESVMKGQTGNVSLGGFVNVPYYHDFVNSVDPGTGRYDCDPKMLEATQSEVITSFSMNPTLGSQRRRLRLAG